MDVKYKRKSEIPDFTHKRVHIIMYDEGIDIVYLIIWLLEACTRNVYNYVHIPIVTGRLLV